MVVSNQQTKTSARTQPLWVAIVPASSLLKRLRTAEVVQTLLAKLLKSIVRLP